MPQVKRGRRDGGAAQIERDEGGAAPAVLEVAADQVEKQHVAQQVHPPRVGKGRQQQLDAGAVGRAVGHAPPQVTAEQAPLAGLGLAPGLVAGVAAVHQRSGRQLLQQIGALVLHHLDVRAYRLEVTRLAIAQLLQLHHQPGVQQLVLQLAQLLGDGEQLGLRRAPDRAQHLDQQAQAGDRCRHPGEVADPLVMADRQDEPHDASA